MKRYSTYKDSGVKWIGEIPSHWKINILKRFSESITTGATPSTNQNAFWESEDYNWYTPGDFTASSIDLNQSNRKISMKAVESGKCKIFPPQTVMMIGIGGTLGRIGITNIVCSANQQITGISLKRNTNSRFAAYFLLSINDFIKAISNSSTLPILNQTRTEKLPFIFPPLSEQRAIVSFLDTELGKIDTYMDKEQQLIEQLKELKQSVIARAVTRGINPNVRMKPSGVNWIGEIPEHWKVKSLRNFLTITSEKGYPEEQLLSVVREQGVIIRNVDSKEENHNFVPDDLSGYKLVKEGQFVINKMKAWQGSYAVSGYRGIVSPAYYTCDLKFVNKEYFNVAVRSKAYVPFFTQYSKGIRVGQWDLSPIGLKEIPFLLPPASEQRAIVDHISSATSKIDKLISEKTKEMEYMKELRQRIISDAVTGKIDVRS